MDIIALGICFVFFLICFFMLENKPLHPATLFFGLYSFILFLSHLNLFGIYQPSDEAYYLIILMLCSFCVGSLISFFPSIYLYAGKIKKAKRKRYRLNEKLFYLLIGFAILFLLYDIAIVLKYVLDGVPMWQVRNWKLAEYGSDNPILSRRGFLEELFRTLVLSPTGMIIPPVTVYTFFDPDQKSNKKLILTLALIYILLSSIAGGAGRLQIVYFGGCFAIGYLLFSNKKQYTNFRKKKYKKYIIISGVAAFTGVILMTRMRVGTGFLWKQIYTYFALPPTLLSIWLPKIKNATPTHGMLSFYGIVGYFFRALKMMGFHSLVPQAYDDAYQYILDAQEFKNTGYGTGNAFVTPVYYLLLDGGKGFLCVMSAIFGGLTAEIHKKVKKKTDIRSFSVYALVMYGVFETFMTIMTSVPAHIISFVLLYLICNRDTTD